MTYPFKFSGSCSSDANVCVPPDATGYKATCVNTTLDTGACNLATDKLSLTIENKGAMLSGKWYRIKAKVENPVVFST